MSNEKFICNVPWKTLVLFRLSDQGFLVGHIVLIVQGEWTTSVLNAGLLVQTMLLFHLKKNDLMFSLLWF